jgi:competence protein ComEA
LLAALSASQVATAQPAAPSKTTVSPVSKSSTFIPIDINHADLKKLMHIKGVGKKRAKAIVQYRQQHGDFKAVNDLAQVKGFTQKRLQTLLLKNQGHVVALP